MKHQQSKFSRQLVWSRHAAYCLEQKNTLSVHNFCSWVRIFFMPDSCLKFSNWSPMHIHNGVHVGSLSYFFSINPERYTDDSHYSKKYSMNRVYDMSWYNSWRGLVVMIQYMNENTTQLAMPRNPNSKLRTTRSRLGLASLSESFVIMSKSFHEQYKTY